MAEKCSLSFTQVFVFGAVSNVLLSPYLLWTRWRAYMILKPIPLAERPALQLKIYAAEALKNRRPNWGSKRTWEGDYLNKVTYLVIRVVLRTCNTLIYAF